MIDWLDIDAFCSGLQQERIRQGLTIAELASRSGVSASTIRAYENEKTCKPRTETLLAVVKALGMDTELFGVDL